MKNFQNNLWQYNQKIAIRTKLNLAGFTKTCDCSAPSGDCLKSISLSSGRAGKIVDRDLIILV